MPTVGVIGACLGDLNDDGHVDVVYPGYYTGSTYDHRSYIFWGTAMGPSPSMPDRTLTTTGGRGCSIGDLNADGNLDVVISNHYNGTNGFVNSMVYLGTPMGPTTMGAIPYATSWAGEPLLADLDGNGELDIIAPNAYNGSSNRTSSRVLFRAGGMISRTEFYPTIGAYNAQVLDWDDDGFLDLYFSSYRDGTRYNLPSQYFAGTMTGPGTMATTTIPSIGVLGVSGEYGNTFDRGWIETFESRALDLGAAAEATWVEVTATVPMGTSVRVQVRSAMTAMGLDSATYSGPTSGMDHYDTFPARLRAIHAGHQFVQYRLEVEAPRAVRAPVVDTVRIHYR